MEVNLAMDLTAEEFFNTLAASLEYDIKTSTGKNVRASNIKPGYSYTKTLKSKMGGKAKVTVTIEEFREPELYVARFDSATGVNRIRYEIENIEDGQIGLSYSEEYEGTKRSYNINSKLFSLLLTIPNKRALKKKFREMEQAIIANRDKTPEELEYEKLDYYE